MLKNYFKTAWRHLKKNRLYSVINIAGLTLGLAIGTLILLWVQDELSFDGFHKNTANIYKLEISGGTGPSRQIFTFGVAPIGPFAKQELPDVVDQVRLKYNNDYSLYQYQDKVFGDETAVYTDPTLFSVFDFPLIQGDARKPFADDHSVVLTKTTAEKFFGQEDPLGKVIVADDKQRFVVSGVISDFPRNSSIQADMIMPISAHLNNMLLQGNDMSNNFSYLDYETWLLLRPGAGLKKLATDIRQIHLNHKSDDTDAEYLLLPLNKMHLYNSDMSDKGMSTVRIFSVIAVLILFIACINYVNLSTAHAMKRYREISMRKIVGARKAHLFLQFVMETTLLFLLAAILAIGLVSLLMPLFNHLSGRHLVFSLTNYHRWTILLTAVIGTLAASCIYPALLLSSFHPLKALAGRISARLGDAMARRALVVVQFVFSVMLIGSTLVITRQLHYIRNKDLGYNKSHVLTFWMRELTPHYEAARAELLKQPGVQAITRSSQNIIRFNGFTGNVNWDGKDPKQNLIVHPIGVDKDLTAFFKMSMAAGHSFTGSPIDSTHFVLNETAVHESGIKDPVGKRFFMGGVQGTIIGVVKDFHYASMKEKIAPVVFWYAPKYFDRIYIKTTDQDAQKVIAAAKEQFARYNGLYPLKYAFLDDVFDNIYRGEQQEGTLFTYFAAIAIFISCLGLIGLAAYTAQVRTREIGIRKVLGASTSSITAMLSTGFMKLVLMAILIATPVAWFWAHNWLQGYAYRVEMHWWLFGLAGLLALLIAFITICFQSIRAALANPVKSLRTE